MLTDYHLHLRPDDTGEAGDYFSEENVDRYLAAAEEHGIDELGVSEHVYRFTQALEIWDHPYWEEQAARRPRRLRASSSAARRSGSGSSATSCPAARTGSRTCSSATSTTWSARSTSSVRGGAVDDRRYDVWEEIGDPDELWSTYFRWQAELVRSGLFDIVSHPDLVKIWGDDRPRPQRDPRFHYEPLVEAIAESGIAVEVSTAGLRKPVGEIYPARALRRDVRRGGRGLRALLGRPRAGSGRLRLRPGARVLDVARRRAGSACSRAASAASSRSAEPVTARTRSTNSGEAEG